MIKLEDTYKYCTACKGPLTVQAECKECPDCGKQYFFNAQATSAVIVTNAKGEILLITRGREPYKGWLGLPGGFVKPNETLEEAADRELQEETGITGLQLTYVSSFFEDYDYRGEDIPVVTALFTGVIKDHTVIKPADDAADFAFMAPADIPLDRIAFKHFQKFLETYIQAK